MCVVASLRVGGVKQPTITLDITHPSGFLFVRRQIFAESCHSRVVFQTCWKEVTVKRIVVVVVVVVVSMQVKRSLFQFCTRDDTQSYGCTWCLWQVNQTSRVNNWAHVTSDARLSVTERDVPQWIMNRIRYEDVKPQLLQQQSFSTSIKQRV